MRKSHLLALALMMVTIAAVADPYYAKEKGEAGRLLTGKVADQQDNPLPDAVVYLSNTRTHVVTTYIVSKDGIYRFPALSPNIDYEVYAQFDGHKSDTKTMSQFDSRKQVQINFKIATK